jgi:hypothetical protein
MSKYVIMASWDDVPHISQEEKATLTASISLHELEARSKGIPALGSGAIYPVPESLIFVPPFPIPPRWPRVFGMDVGWNRTACVWGAYDAESDTIYLYSEHYVGKAEPSIHADAIKARGAWIPGVIDPASNGRSQSDGSSLLETYIRLGLELSKADNSVEAGIQTVWQRLSSGRLKVFNHLANFQQEFRIYRRDKNGKVVKNNDHALDAARYLCMSGLEKAIVEPDYDEYQEYIDHNRRLGVAASGRSSITGY